ncbi:Ig-like domain-containing protein [Mycolicibacterium sp.]|uniref:Ig-like domain-containing protein n=1 Tax=Mycolicibacterium sp. TaxID=2320850 RepID=UPI0037C928B0
MSNNARVTSAPSQRASTRVAARSVRPAGRPARLPSPDEALAGAAQWIRRQVGAALFNAAPTISFDPAQNAPSQYGVVTGNLNGADREGDKISYLLTSAPTHGSVIIRPDGTFSYVPTDEFAATGGTDTFMVRADDHYGNPPHINLAGVLHADPTDGQTQISVTLAPGSTAAPEQLQMEALAAQIANSPRLQWTKDVLRPWWFAMAALKYLPAGGLDSGNIARLNQALDEFTFGVAMRMVNTDAARPRVLTYEIPPHAWGPLAIPGGRWAYDNPDSVYRTIPVNAKYSYVITGKFVGERPADLNFSVYTDPNVTNSVDNIGLHDLVVNPDGTFTITVDAGPDDGTPNHLHMTHDAQQVFIRDTLGDWTDSPVELSVSRVDGLPAVAPKTYDQLVGGAVSLALTSGVALYGLMLLPFVQPVNWLGKPTHTFGTLSTQRQSSTLFHLDDDQAMVVTVTLGDAGYFTTPITDAWTITPDYRNHQSSLNSSQAVRNADGSYTLVISKTDPGVANWVDTAGLSQGSLFVRWQLPNANPDAGSPTVTSRVVRLSDLPSVLPSDTVFVTPAQRAEQLAIRQQGYDSRFDRFLAV